MVLEYDDKYRPLDSMRGICSLLIVWHHLAPMMGIPYTFDFGNTIVLFFFILSGFGLTLAWKERFGGNSFPWGVYRRFVVKRCSRLFPLQWLTLLLFLLFDVGWYSLYSIPFHLTLTQSFIPLWQVYYVLNVPSWFLSSLFFCYLLCPFLLNYSHRNQRLFIVLCLVSMVMFFLIVGLLPETIGRTWLTYYNPIARLLDFSVGICLALFWTEIEERKTHVSKRNGTLLELFFVVVTIAFMVYQPFFDYNPYRVLRYPFIIGLIVVFTFAKGYVSYILSNRTLNWLGSISFAVYMVHCFILGFTKDITCIPLWLNVLFTYFLVIFSSHLITQYFLPRGAKGVQFLFDRAFAWKDRS